jgi:hypothetical protein
MAETRKERKEVSPHPAVGAIVEWMIPAHHQEYVIGDLSDQHLPTWPYFWKAFEWLCFIVSSQVRPSFHLPLFAAEAGAFIAAFAGTPFDQGFFIALSAGLLGLVLRDAYAYPRKESAFHQGVDTAAAVFFMLIVEVFEAKFSPQDALSNAILLRGLALSLLTVSMVRVLFRRPKEHEPFGGASYRTTQAMTCLWMLAAIIVMWVNQSLTPELFPHQGLLISLPIIAMGLAFRGKKNSLDGTITGGYVTVLQDHAAQKVQRKLDGLWVATESPDSAAHLFFEFLAIGLFGLLTLIAPLLWVIGYLPSDALDWLTAGTNAIAVVALSVLWIAIRKANENLARRLKQETSKKGTA